MKPRHLLNHNNNNNNNNVYNIHAVRDAIFNNDTSNMSKTPSVNIHYMYDPTSIIKDTLRPDILSVLSSLWRFKCIVLSGYEVLHLGLLNLSFIWRLFILYPYMECPLSLIKTILGMY